MDPGFARLGCPAAGLLLLASVAVVIVRSITRPLAKTVNALRDVAEGDLTVSFDATGHDEVARMATALNTALAKVRSTVGGIGATAATLASSSEELTTISRALAANAAEESAQVSVVSGAAGDVSSEIDTVAGTSTEMTSSIAENARNAGDAATVAARAAQQADETNTTVTRLGESSAEIGNVVKMISSIAEQTSLLALSATIEAARAEIAGKGFAVVAGEVKELAHETASATADISERIATIQAETTAAVEAIAAIATVVRDINDTQATIASAVEEQTASGERPYDVRYRGPDGRERSRGFRLGGTLNDLRPQSTLT